MQIRTCQACDSTFEQSRGYPAKRCPECRGAKAKRPVVDTFTISISCPLCESSVKALNQRTLKGEFVALVKCQGSNFCGHEFLVRAFVAPAMRGVDGYVSRCGTEAGAQRHYRNGEQPCADCLRAHSDRAKARDRERKNKETAA